MVEGNILCLESTPIKSIFASFAASRSVIASPMKRISISLEDFDLMVLIMSTFFLEHHKFHQKIH